MFPGSGLAGSPWINLVPVKGRKVEENVLWAPNRSLPPNVLILNGVSEHDVRVLLLTLKSGRFFTTLELLLIEINILQWSV